MSRRKSLVPVINGNLYYYSSEDSEDDLDRMGAKSRLNTIQSNFTEAGFESPTIIKNKNPNLDKNEIAFSTMTFIRSPIKRSKSDVFFNFSDQKSKKYKMF